MCPGPGIVDFSKIVSLREMIDHIYGRVSLITTSNRPHMFIRELMLYVDHLRSELKKLSLGISPRSHSYFKEFKQNLLDGVEYYRQTRLRAGRQAAHPLPRATGRTAKYHRADAARKWSSASSAK